MACRQIWQDIYAIESFKSTTSLTSILAIPPQFSGTKGLRGTFATNQKYNLLVDDAYPLVKAANAVVEKNLATGKSLQNTISITPVTARPETVTIPVVFNAHNLSMFLRLFFQDGVTLGNGVTNTALQIMTVVPYDSACPIVFGNLVRFRQDEPDVDAVDQALQGITPVRIVVRGAEGGLIEGEVEFYGAKWEDYDLSAKVVAASLFDTLPPLKFEDLTVKLDATAVSIPSFEFTFERTVVTQYYNQVSAQSVTMGRLMVTGTITVPWNDPYSIQANQQVVIGNYRAGTLVRVSLVWGNAAFTQFTVGQTTPPTGDVDVLTAGAKNLVVGNYFGIHTIVKLTDYDENDIDEVPMVPMTFKSVEDSQSTVAGITMRLGYVKVDNDWTE